LARLGDRIGEMKIEIMSSNAHLDLGRLHADVTVRPADRLPDDLVGSVAARLGFGHYVRRDAPPGRWLGLAGPLVRSKIAGWMTQALPQEEIAGGADSYVTLAGMVGAGLGQGALPCVVGDADPRLERVRGVFPDLAVDIWVASHADMIEVPRLRAARALLAEALADDADRLAGVSG
jgi:DNA-binding transcriptional LysR family regulator